MDGFFTAKQTKSKSRVRGKTLSCAACGLYKHALSPKMRPFGGFERGIMNIGEAPGEVEDERGKPWQGKTGRLLKKAYRSLGVDLFEDCLNLNAVNCHPQKNTTPSGFQVDCCRSVIVGGAIDEQMPKVIVPLGSSALYSVIGNRFAKEVKGISRWRGFAIPDQDLKAWICPTFHPSYVERSEGQEVYNIWVNDLKRALKLSEIKLPKPEKINIEYLKDLSPLDNIQDGSIAFDFETTGLKPHTAGHRIVCASVAINPYKVYAFMMPETKAGRRPFLDLLARSTVGKRAHNMKFEDTWSLLRLKQEVNGWEWDSMLASHILDNRPGIASLKFQTYVNFGVSDYSSEIQPYLHAKEANSQNRIMELLRKPGGEEMLLEYCALDSIYEYRLSDVQIQTIGYDFLPF